MIDTAEQYNPFADERLLVELNQVIDLLSLLAGVDFRKPDPDAARVWLAIARLGRWTVGEAFRAAALHLRDSTEFCKPAHLTARIRAERSMAADRFKALPASPASEEQRAVQKKRIDALIGGFAAMPPETRVMGTVEAARKRAGDQVAALAALDELISRDGAS